MIQTVRTMAETAAGILHPKLHSVWLYGSVVLDDFRQGWSDIDFLAFSNAPIAAEQAQRLLYLRQELSLRYPDNPYFRSLEGAFISLDEFQKESFSKVVYWGTTGQRITDRYELDAFSRYELAAFGRVVYGGYDTSLFTLPSEAEMTEAVRRHYEAIRRCADQTEETLYSCGWLLDISRCIRTLRCGDVIGKTQAGEWALKEHLFADDEPLKKALRIRQNPAEYKDLPEIRSWLRSLRPVVHQYADVLEKELNGF